MGPPWRPETPEESREGTSPLKDRTAARGGNGQKRLRGMADTAVMTDLGRVTVTGGSGFLGANLVSELLNYEHWDRCSDRVRSALPAPPLPLM